MDLVLNRKVNVELANQLLNNKKDIILFQVNTTIVEFIPAIEVGDNFF